MEYSVTEKELTLSRRDVIRLSIPFGISLFSMLTNAHYVLDAEYNLPPETKERYLVETEEGYRVGLLLGQHGAINPKTGEIKASRVTDIKINDLYKPVGAFFLDTLADYLDPRVTAEVLRDALMKVASDIPGFYKVPIEYGFKNNIPFVFGDITLRGFSLEDFVNQSGNLQQKRYYAGLATMIAEVGRQIAEKYSKVLKGNMTRRAFLKLLVGGAGLSTIYLSSPAYTHFIRSLGIKPDSSVSRDFQAIFSDLIHPNNYSIVMRNIVWALKCRDFYDQGIIPKEKIINILGGLGHQFFDFFIRHPEIAKRYWLTFNYGEIAKKFSQGDLGWVHKSLLFYPSNKEVKIIEHESLADLVV